MDPALHHKMKVDEAYDGSGDGAADPTSEDGVTRQIVVSVDREHRDGCAS